jgi:uncharacterized LabA/DUF88 family protein
MGRKRHSVKKRNSSTPSGRRPLQTEEASPTPVPVEGRVSATSSSSDSAPPPLAERPLDGPTAPSPSALSPQSPILPPPTPGPRLVRTACYVDFENLFYRVFGSGRDFNTPRAVRSLVALSRKVCGEGFAHTAVYANWDSITACARFAQNDWAQVGWRTVAVPTREDQVSDRVVKNLVDFVMSLDILEEARDRGFEHIFLVTGDADFCEVVERLKRLRRQVTVVALKSSLSYRLRQAADRFFLWEVEEIAGKATFPLRPAQRPPKVSPGLHRDPDASELDLLRQALMAAQDDVGGAQVDWETVRDDYYLPLARCASEEADALVRDLAQAGFILLESQRVRDGSWRNFLRIPV